MHYIFVIVPIIPHTYTPRVQKQWNHSWTDVTAQGVEMSHLGRLLVAHAWAPAQGTLLEVGKSPGKWIIFRETMDFPHLGFTPGYITYFIYLYIYYAGTATMLCRFCPALTKLFRFPVSRDLMFCILYENVCAETMCIV